MAGKKPSGSTPAGGGELQEGKAKVAFPRPKAAELQEALGHLEYFKNQSWALTFALNQITKDLRLCESEVIKWTARIKKLKEMT
jgi:hypothetical protein